MTFRLLKAGQQRKGEGMASDEVKLLNVKQVAERLAISERTIWRLVQDDPAFPQPLKLRSAARWRASDIESYINAKAGGRAA